MSWALHWTSAACHTLKLTESALKATRSSQRAAKETTWLPRATTKWTSPPKVITPSSSKCKCVLHNQFPDQAEWLLNLYLLSILTLQAKALLMRFQPHYSNLIQTKHQTMLTSACHVSSNQLQCNRFKFLIKRISTSTSLRSKYKLSSPLK